MEKHIILLASALLIALPVTTSAQPFPQQPPRNQPRKAQIEEKIRTMKIWKLTEELDLTQDQASRFFPMLNEFENDQKELNQERRDVIMKLNDAVWDSNPDSETINQLLDQLEEFEQKQLELRNQLRKDVSSILTPEQVGKMVLFNIKFPDIVRNLIQEFERKPPLKKLHPERNRDR